MSSSVIPHAGRSGGITLLLRPDAVECAGPQGDRDAMNLEPQRVRRHPKLAGERQSAIDACALVLRVVLEEQVPMFHRQPAEAALEALLPVRAPVILGRVLRVDGI